jgi:cytochrome o ubiquinol oxidase subunit I
LIWMWGHPEVYILMLPALGIFSEVVSTFSRKRIASYTSNILGMAGISALALSVWLHHFFTMGASANVNAFFGTMTLLIGIPTAVLFFTWIATMYKGRIRFETPMLWFLGFVSVFTIGGLSGLVLAIPPVDFQMHNNLFLVAHFHSNVIGGVLFGIFCGICYWFPKFTGIKLNERIGRQAFWCWIVGFCMSFIPMYVLGFMGAPRRLDHYDASTGWQPLFMMMFIGGIIIAIGTALLLAQIIASVIQKRRLRDTTGDPWDGRTLEWLTPSAPAFYNFTVIPKVHSRDAFWEMKQHGLEKPKYEDMLIPKNTATGIYISALAFLAGFGFVWEIIWLAVVSLLGIIIVVIVRTFNEDIEYVLTAAEVEKLEQSRKENHADRHQKYHVYEEDMGTWEFVKIVLKYCIAVIRTRKLRTW